MFGSGHRRAGPPVTSERAPGERAVHYGCHEFRDDSERVIQGRAHPELEQLYHMHLACCRDCQRYHHRLEAIYRRPRRIAPLDSFSRDREFESVLARSRSENRRRLEVRRLSSSGVGVLATVATILALALIFPSFGARLFGPPAVAELEWRPDSSYVSYGDEVRIPERRGLGHNFGRVIGVDAEGQGAELSDAEGRPATGDSLTVGARIATRDAAVQVAFGRLLANFQPGTVARWSSASPTLIEFGLVSGMLAFRYDRRPGDPILQVRTPSAVVRVIGTVFTVAVDDRGRTLVSVLRGKVEVVKPDNGRSLGEVEAGLRFDISDSSYRDLGRREVAAALPLSELGELSISIDDHGDLSFEEPEREAGQIPRAWTVPGLSGDPAQRTLDRVLDPEAGTEPEPAPASEDHARQPRVSSRERPTLDAGEAATLELIDSHARRERERKATVEARLERCRVLQSEPKTRFRAARCLGDFMHEFGDQPEAVEGLLLLGTLRMDFAHDYQSATRNFEEFLRRAPQHPKAELARYKLVLAAFEAGYMDHALQRGRAYLRHHPDGQYVGRILQRFPTLKSAL